MMGDPTNTNWWKVWQAAVKAEDEAWNQIKERRAEAEANWNLDEKSPQTKGPEVEEHNEVSFPKHYAIAPGIEAADIIVAVLSGLDVTRVEAYYLANFLKYRLRIGDKDPVEKDLAKSNWYRDRLRVARERD